jgi:hypothetical protein
LSKSQPLADAGEGLASFMSESLTEVPAFTLLLWLSLTVLSGLNQILFQAPQPLCERDVIRMRIDETLDAWIQTLHIGFSSAPHLFDAGKVMEQSALLKHVSQ